jgi:hypothetical protein
MPDSATAKKLEKSAFRVNEAAHDCAISRAFLYELLKRAKPVQLVALGYANS